MNDKGASGFTGSKKPVVPQIGCYCDKRDFIFIFVESCEFILKVYNNASNLSWLPFPSCELN